MTILRAATYETELGDHDFCLSRSHYIDNDPTSGQRAARALSNLGPPHQELHALPTELLHLQGVLHICILYISSQLY